MKWKRFISCVLIKNDEPNHYWGISDFFSCNLNKTHHGLKCVHTPSQISQHLELYFCTLYQHLVTCSYLRHSCEFIIRTAFLHEHTLCVLSADLRRVLTPWPKSHRPKSLFRFLHPSFISHYSLNASFVYSLCCFILIYCSQIQTNKHCSLYHHNINILHKIKCQLINKMQLVMFTSV